MAAASAAETLFAAWARHFFGSGGSDDAVQSYCTKSLLAAVEDGESLSELAPVLQDFLPPGGNPAALLEGLRELEAALQQPPDQWRFDWLQPPSAAAAAAAAKTTSEAAEGGADAPGTRGASPVANEPAARTNDPAAAPAPASSAASAGQSAAQGRCSSLSVAAAEFKPFAAAAASVTAGLSAMQLGGTSSSSCGTGGWNAAPEAARSADGWQQDDWAGSSSWGAAEAEAAGAVDDAAAAAEMVAGGPTAEAAFLAVLGEQFPLFSAEALRQLFEEQGGSLAGTISTLCSLEAEVEGQAAAAAWGSPPQQAAGPSFTADDFPTLGAPRGASSAAGARPAASAGDGEGAYASRARAAAALPDQPARRGRSGSRPGRGAPAPSAAAPAPIWQQREGVARFATGAAAAQEYAELRAEARDHARLRNAYFQQATQAYLAGNRALARELGAQGRRHGEMMHAAHAAAAAEIFSRRNPQAAASIAGASGARAASSSSQTVDLHGLHVAEVADLLERLVEERRAGGARRLRVVVGAGSHGKVPARLPAAVRRWLQAAGLPFSEPYEGLLEISL